MNYFKALAATAVVLIAAVHANPAAAAPGEEIFKSTYIRTNVVKGKTTADQVLAKFGEPASQTMDDSSETWIYQRSASSAPAQKKKGGGFGGLMGLVKGVAQTAYEIAPESAGAASRLYSTASRAEQTANALGGVAGAGEGSESQAGGTGPSLLQINFIDGIVSSFSLR